MKLLIGIIFSLIIVVSSFSQTLKPNTSGLTRDDFVYVGANADGSAGYFVIKPSVKRTLKETLFAYLRIEDDDNFLITRSSANCTDRTIVEYSREGYREGKQVKELNPEPKPNKISEKTIGALLLDTVCTKNEFFE